MSWYAAGKLAGLDARERIPERSRERTAQVARAQKAATTGRSSRAWWLGFARGLREVPSC